MEFEKKGTIIKINDTFEGTGKDGKPFQKLTYAIDTGAEWNSLAAFEVFGQDKVEQFRKYNSVGDKVSVKFNTSTNEWQGKYFTTLQSWRCTKDDSQTTEKETVQTEEESDLPF
jgi:hypothetical protein